MSEILKVLNKRVELKSEVVEFKSIGQLNLVRAAMKNTGSKALDIADIYMNAGSDLKDELKKLEAVQSDGNKVLKEFEKNAKTLGVNPNDIKEYKDALVHFKSNDGTIKDIKSIL